MSAAGSSRIAAAASKSRDEVGFDVSKGRAANFTARNRDDVDGGVRPQRLAVPAEEIAEPALGAVPRDRGPELA